MGVLLRSNTFVFELRSNILLRCGACCCVAPKRKFWGEAEWTECNALNGVLACSIDADGVCDGT